MTSMKYAQAIKVETDDIYCVVVVSRLTGQSFLEYVNTFDVCMTEYDWSIKHYKNDVFRRAMMPLSMAVETYPDLEILF